MQKLIRIDHDTSPDHEGHDNRVFRLNEIRESLEEQCAGHCHELDHQIDFQQENGIATRKEFLFEESARRNDHRLNTVVVDQIPEQVTRRQWQSSQFFESSNDLFKSGCDV